MHSKLEGLFKSIIVNRTIFNSKMGDSLEAKIENIANCQRKLNMITADLERKKQQEEKPEKW
ncbi:hypothetical protein HHI36_022750 [Cryptolaemus montrouzieri]|uniref:Uncharacterized protein n=1 Tax=Cryptolaemus montrouzieri TaxID=559131 RepID=A0ABD2N1V6_9CUCU